MTVATLWHLPVAWVGARLGLYPAGLDDRELTRVAIRRRVMWSVLWSTCFFFYLSGTFTTADLSGLAGLLWWASVFGMTASTFASFRLRAFLAQAMRDRTSAPTADAGAVRHVIASREGGWPMLLVDRDGRRIWLTGHERDLRRLRAALARTTSGVRIEVRVTLTYYPRTHVIKEISGVTVEEHEVARAFAARLATSPAA